MVAIQLVIKNPTATSVVHSIVVDSESSVLQLKERLSVEYPGNPPASTQKLIFSGRLLQDASTIGDLLAQHDTSFPQTFHIVVSSSLSSSSLSSPSPTSSSSASSSTSPSRTTPVAVPSSPSIQPPPQSPTAVCLVGQSVDSIDRSNVTGKQIMYVLMVMLLVWLIRSIVRVLLMPLLPRPRRHTINNTIPATTSNSYSNSSSMSCQSSLSQSVDVQCVFGTYHAAAAATTM
jgi:hypothetical protein